MERNRERTGLLCGEGTGNIKPGRKNQSLPVQAETGSLIMSEFVSAWSASQGGRGMKAGGDRGGDFLQGCCRALRDGRGWPAVCAPAGRASFAAGLPGGLAMLGTVSADITQYFVFMLRVLQKIAYLYSYPDFELKEEKLSDETLNSLIVFIGVMVGAQGANAAVGILTKTITDKVVKAIPRKALTKTTVWYPLVKKVAKAIGIKMTKPVLAKSASKVIPVLGGVASGGISYVSFKLSANRLKKKLREMPLCDPESELYSRHKKNSSEDE